MDSVSTEPKSPATGPDAGIGGIPEPDWLGACRRMVAAQRELFLAEPGIAERTVYAGRGEGGDRALVIDRRAEDMVFSELERLHAEGGEFVVVSEERGEVSFGDGTAAAHVIVDPIDGSLNARRTLPSHALSIAVTSGPSMADVELGYVYDFGAEEEFVARRGGGAFLGDRPLSAAGPGYGLELVGIEAGKPERVVPMLDALAGKAYRFRVLGSIALALCYVAAGRFDGMLTARACRSVDAAAGQLIAREAGAALELPEFPLAQAPLGLGARYHVTASLDSELLALLRPVQALAEPVEKPS
jgi:myo-inositol-1(or 4)-monophosphatase